MNVLALLVSSTLLISSVCLLMAEAFSNVYVDDTECIGCDAGYYCPGDGRLMKCGFDSLTKYMYSYGSSVGCSPCPKGWVRLTFFKKI